MKRIVAILLFAHAGITGIAQFGNEWINYSQEYYRFPITQEGIYRLTYADMVAAGISAGTIVPDDFQIFAREEEQWIRVQDAGTAGLFEAGDYLEFYGRGTDGELDEQLYPTPSDHTNPYYSLFSDTIYYYLTWSAGPHRRMVEETETGTGGFSTVDYAWRTEQVEWNSNYNAGEKDNVGSSYPQYVAGEGWTRGALVLGGVHHVYPSTTNAWQGAGAPDATVETVIAGANNPVGGPDHRAQISYDGILAIDTLFEAYAMLNLSYTIPNASIPVSFIDFAHEALGTTAEKQIMAYIRMRYPHTFDLENQTQYRLELPYNFSDPKSPFQFTNLNAATPLLYVVNDTVRTIPLVFSGSGYDALVPNGPAGEEISLLFLDESEVKSISGLTPVNGSGAFTDFSTFPMDSVFLIITHSNFWTAAQAYAVYRSARYNTLVADVEELYDQFGGGIPKHILGIRRFADYCLSIATVSPSNLLLVGKSVRQADSDNSSDNLGSRNNVASYADNFVPSMGYPPSDMLITSGLSGSFGLAPAIPTGRLSVVSEQGVYDYLAKVVELEMLQDMSPYMTIEDRDWMKQVMHFGGGSGGSQQALFKGYLEDFEEIIEDAYYGGNVSGFYLADGDPSLNPSVSQAIRNRFEKGVSLVTFFGHSAPGTFDFSIDSPDQWGNAGGKYPLMVANACYSGDIHEPTASTAYPSTSEDYVSYASGGVIGYISTVKVGYEVPLYGYTYYLYDEISRNNYEGTIGQHMQTIINDWSISGSMNLSYQSTYFGMTLNGDPSIILNTHENSELVLEPEQVYFEPSTITLSDADFDLSVIVTNTGRSSLDTFVVEVVRYFPNGADSIYTQEVYGIDYKDTVTFTMPTSHNIAVGTNVFDIRVDLSVGNEVLEFVESTNNQLTEELIITTDGIRPVWPYEYAIIPDDSISLKASTIDPLAPVRNYLIEIDTNDVFSSSSPGYLSATISSGGGVLEWDLVAENYILEDSVVYFWRVAADSTTPIWYESSFQYINNRVGWSQAHFYQFEDDNEYGSVYYDRPDREFEFASSSNSYKIITCDVYSDPQVYDDQVFTLWALDGSLGPGGGEYGTCDENVPAIHVGVVDELTLTSWGKRMCAGDLAQCDSLHPDCATMINPMHGFGNFNDLCECRDWRAEKYFIFFQDDSLQLNALNDMLNDPRLDNKYVVIYSMIYATYDSWAQYCPALFTTMSNIGAATIGSGAAQDSVGFAYFTQIGNPSVSNEVIAPIGPAQYIQLQDTVFGSSYSGTIKSPVVGPSFEWEALHWEHHAQESPTKDSLQLRLYGVDYTGQETLVLDTAVINYVDSIVNLSAIIDANVYPWARLEAFLEDDSLFTPTQIDRWQLVHSEVPEAALNANIGYYFSLSNDTLEEGQELQFAIAIENITELHMDSLLVHYWIEDQDRVETYLTYDRQDSLRALGVFIDTITVSTEGFGGLNSLWIEANPVPLGSVQSIYDQPEQYHFNNIAQIPFYANEDITNPMLDVTFDGIHILDGDIVSAAPEIVITLDDENPYLLLEDEVDTANFVVQLEDPQGNLSPVFFKNGLGEDVMQWIPADGPDNKARIIWSPTFYMDGEYELLVKGDDKSGNISGDRGYRISFEVFREATVTELLNYPNPFSTRTQFIFTLTGVEPPSDISIQIFTVAGNVVREIDENELGPLHIGRNFTDFWWDATDQFGDPLANGVYFYRVVVQDNGEMVKYNETSAGQYFYQDKQGAMYGKMMLIR